MRLTDDQVLDLYSEKKLNQSYCLNERSPVFYYRDLKQLKMLVSLGANPHLNDCFLRNLSFYVRSIEDAKYIYDLGVDFNTRDHCGRSVLNFAPNLEVLEFFLEVTDFIPGDDLILGTLPLDCRERLIKSGFEIDFTSEQRYFQSDYVIPKDSITEITSFTWACSKYFPDLAAGITDTIYRGQKHFAACMHYDQMLSGEIDSSNIPCFEETSVHMVSMNVAYELVKILIHGKEKSTYSSIRKYNHLETARFEDCQDLIEALLKSFPYVSVDEYLIGLRNQYRHIPGAGCHLDYLFKIILRGKETEFSGELTVSHPQLDTIITNYGLYTFFRLIYIALNMSGEGGRYELRIFGIMMVLYHLREKKVRGLDEI